MRRTLLAAAGAIVLAAGTVTVAGATTTRVDGSHFGASGLQVRAQGCLDPLERPDTVPRARIRKGPGKPPMGNRTVGWAPAEAGYGIGTLAPVVRPTALEVLSISVRPTGDQVSGQAVARYQPSSDPGIWIGRVTLGLDPVARWHRIDAGALPFDWRHYTDGVQDGDVAGETIADFTASHGGDGDGAQVGFLYGCDGGGFFIDDLRVGADGAVRRYDFEGYRTRSQLLVGGKARKQVTVTYGRKRDLGVRLREAVGGDGVSGKLLVQRRAVSDRKFRTYDKLRTRRTGKAGITVKPSRGTAYRLKYAGSESHEGDTSSVLKVLVAFDVTARLSTTSVRRGRTFHMSGRVRPGVRTGVALQRRADGKWVTVSRGRTSGDGTYRLAGSTQVVGRTYWRVKAAGANGLVGASSGTKELKVTSPTPPPPDDDPPPPPDDPPPPPDDPPPPEG